MCYVKISSRFAQSYVCNKFINIPLSRKLHNLRSLIFPESYSFLAASTHQNPWGISGQATSLLFCRCLNFPFNASSCNLSQRDASSWTLSQNTNNPGLGESIRLLNSLLYHSIALFVRWCINDMYEKHSLSSLDLNYLIFITGWKKPMHGPHNKNCKKIKWG